MRNYLLTLSYDGTDFHGWQSQTASRTVQGEVEKALGSLLGANVSVTASGRTDEGVHAIGQAANFISDTTIPADKIPAALNPHLPPDIRAVGCREVPLDFSARKSAKRKTYIYRIYQSPQVLPHIDRYALRVERLPDRDLMTSACKLIEGTHDFAAFRCLGSSAKTTVRTVYRCEWAEYPSYGVMPPICELTVSGDGFLYKMVRLIVGTLLRLGEGKLSLADIETALGGKEPFAKIPAHSRGLILAGVEYGGA